MLKTFVSNTFWAARDRLVEKSTWRGFIWSTAGAFGYVLGVEYVEAIAGISAAAFGLLEVIFRQNGYLRDKDAV